LFFIQNKYEIQYLGTYTVQNRRFRCSLGALKMQVWKMRDWKMAAGLEMTDQIFNDMRNSSKVTPTYLK